MRKLVLCATAITLFVAAGVVLADTLTLKDGTVLEGRVAEQGDRYWIKLANGQSRFIPKVQVARWDKGSAPGASSPPPAPAAGAPAATPSLPSAAEDKGSNPATKPGVVLSFAETRSRAERVDAPLAAVGLWQSFIDGNPDSPELPAAKQELERWKQLDKDKAEKINGKWIGGEERRKLLEKVSSLLKEADELRDNQTIKAIQKLEEAVKLYPNNFRANFELGYFCLEKAQTGGLPKLDAAIRALETATRLRPKSAAAWSNLAIAYNFRQQYERSVLAAYKAAQIEDSEEVVQNLINSLSYAPPGMRENNSKVRPVMDEAIVLARKYGISTSNRQHWVYVRPSKKEAQALPDADDEKNTRPGVIGNGSGFLVSADGYIITNRHVAEEKNCIFMCRFVDGTEKSAKVIAISDDSDLDLALLKLQPDKDKPYPFLQLAESDEPGPGADCAALGYPIAHVMNYSMQVTAGTVSSINNSEPYHITLTAKITHGNSGGPLVDKYGNAIGVVSAGLTAYTETYGKAISAGQVRKFLEKHKDKYKATFQKAKPGDKPLSTEDIYKKDSPAVLCIILIRSGGSGGENPG